VFEAAAERVCKRVTYRARRPAEVANPSWTTPPKAVGLAFTSGQFA
jgi:hypothetical protein